MAKKETLKPNVVEPTLFVGVGGIGSRIIKGVANLCKNDDRSNIRFVVLDTDVNDLSRLKEGVRIESVQTSSTRSIKDYLDFDDDARENWFPNNRILDSKTVSEGAGQVRAISRIALNASIRQGTIKKLYQAIDELYLKDGSDSQKAIKVVIASTSTGGTGSGIAMEAAMIIRDYVNTNYPQSAAIIRGFFIMPGVMKTVIKSDTEIASQERNGYSTIKEINAFMMKGSGFFDSNEDLMRYKDLCLMIPLGNGGFKKLDNLPFDFCFLIERTNDKQKSMRTLQQYEKFTSQCIYEQNIGVLRKTASSQEDNVIKEFINPKYLGRCRFGSAGAAVLRYPYESIRDYIAYSWAQKNIVGTRGSQDSEDTSFIKDTWTSCDNEYKEELKAFENGNRREQPERGKSYRNSLDTNSTIFGEELKDRTLGIKYSEYVTDRDENVDFPIKMDGVVDEYLKRLSFDLTEKFRKNILAGGSSADEEEGAKQTIDDIIYVAKEDANKGGLRNRYNSIKNLNNVNESKALNTIADAFIKEAFWSENGVKSDSEKSSTLENFISLKNNAMHPNAVRYLLYALLEKMEAEAQALESEEDYNKNFKEITSGRVIKNKKGEAKQDTKQYQVKGNIGKEVNLLGMCEAIDEGNAFVDMLDSDALSDAQRMLSDMYELVNNRTNVLARNLICVKGRDAVNTVINEFEKFYDSFEDEIVSIEKAKNSIVSDLEFHNGDCVKNLFDERPLLDMVVELNGNSSGNSKDTQVLYSEIYDAIKKNARTTKRRGDNPLLREANKNIFKDVIIERYKTMVEEHCADSIDLDILHAMKFEFEMRHNVKMKATNDSAQIEDIIRESFDKEKINEYINDKVKMIRNLASPSLSKNDLMEDRTVEGIAYGTGVKEGGGLRFSDFSFLDAKNCSDTVSKRELRCFTSTYGLEPNSISMFKYVKPEGNNELFSERSGDYFKEYQTYMENIGPDSRINPIITPHIDRRWNSISVMPEISMEYQRQLMGHIHEAFFYGFIYNAITFSPLSTYEPDNLVYCLENEGKKIHMYVSNGTKCDELYEVVDSLYFDRKLVKTIHAIADKNRTKSEEKPSVFEKTVFAQRLKELKRSKILNKSDEPIEDTTVSIFELPVLYYGSLPERKKDAAELSTMVRAIMGTLYKEICTFEKGDDAQAIFKRYVIEHYKLLLENHKKVSVLKNTSDEVILSIRDIIAAYLEKAKIDYKKDFEKNNI